MKFSYEVQMEFTTINYYKGTQIIPYLLYKPSPKEDNENEKKSEKIF